MSPGATSERVYLEIKRRLADASLRPGQRIEPAALGEALFASVTPVRDALHRLAGERLVETPRHNGFRVPRLTESALRDLYHWRGQLLALALRNMRATIAWPTSSTDAPEDVALFDALAQATASAEHAAAIASLNERLAPLRRAEREVLASPDEEAGRLHGLLLAENWHQLRIELSRYHSRRMRATPEILAVYFTPKPAKDAPDQQ